MVSEFSVSYNNSCQRLTKASLSGMLLSGKERPLHRIISKQTIAPKVHRMEVEAPEIAGRRRAGQFVLIRINEQGERFPLTIVDSDPDRGTITLVVQEAGKSTTLLGSLQAGEEVRDVVGPLGNPTPIARYGTTVCVGGGIGVAEIYPIAAAFKQVGNRVISIIGARSKDLVILEQELQSVSDRLEVATDDGSYGHHGFVTDVLAQVIKNEQAVDLIMAVGPVPMMKAVSELTKPHGIKTLVSLNPLMVDGTGMCGACRVTVGGETKFTCIDGPDFDAHQVDFDELSRRQQMYGEQEKESMTCFKESHASGECPHSPRS